MKAKCTILFNLVTGGAAGQTLQRQGGWTESLYADQPTIDQIRQNFFGQGGNPLFGNIALCPARAALLPTGAQIVGQRIQQVDPVGPTTSTGFVYPGGSGLATDVPQMGLLTTLPAVNVRNVRRWIIRGIPDARVVNGEYSPAAQFSNDISTFFTVLGAWNFRALDLNAVGVDIINIDATGKVTSNGNSPFVQFDVIQLNRVQTGNGTVLSGKFQVATIGPNNNNFTLGNWTFGLCTGGRARKIAFIYPFIDAARIAINRVVVKKVGVPSIRFRGRRSKAR